MTLTNTGRARASPGRVILRASFPFVKSSLHGEKIINYFQTTHSRIQNYSEIVDFGDYV